MEIKYDDEYCKGCEHKDIYVKERPLNMLGFGPSTKIFARFGKKGFLSFMQLSERR